MVETAKTANLSPDKVLGRAPEDLTLEERHALSGSWIAMEIYSPQTLPLRRIEALGANAQDCIEMLRRRGLDPAKFEFSLLKPPF